MTLLQQMDRRRRAGDYLHALLFFTGPEDNKEDAFRAHFLGKGSDGEYQTCLLLEAASQGHAAAILDELTNNPLAQTLFPSECACFMFQARMKLIESIQILDDSSELITQLISEAVDLYRRAYQYEKKTPPTSEAAGTPDFVKKLQGRWKTALIEVEKQKRLQDSRVADWDDPVLLMVAESLYYLLNDGMLSMEGKPVESSVLLAMETEKKVINPEGEQKSVKIPEGFLAHLVVEKVPGGTGLLYPDCRYCGYLPLAPGFRQGLRNVMTVLKGREEWSDPQAFSFNYRWRLIPLSPKSGFKLPQAVGAIDGRSAEAAFASAVLAATRNERLDQQTVISACFDEPETNDRLHQVASVSEKLLAFRDEQIDDHPEVLHFVGMKTHRLHKFVLYEKEGKQPALPQDAKVYDWTVRFSYVESFDQAYRLLTSYCRITKLVKDHLKTRAIELLKGTCNPYVFSKLSKLQIGKSESMGPESETKKLLKILSKYSMFQKAKSESMGPESENKKILSAEEAEALLMGNLDTQTLRNRILAESGLGKSTMLIKAEELIASTEGDRIPLRIGAGPMSLATDDSGDLLRLPALSDFKWDIKPSELEDFLSLLAQRLFSDLISDKTERDQWICEAVQRGNVVFLFDALDQTSEAPRFQNFLTCDGVNRCPVIITGRPETRQLKWASYDQQYDWDQHTYFAEPFDKVQVGEFWGYTHVPIQLLVSFESCQITENPRSRIELLYESADWEALLKVPLLLTQIKKLAEEEKLADLRNREAVYFETLKMLVDHGHKSYRQSSSIESEFEGLDYIEILLGEVAWEMISQEANQSDRLIGMTVANFTGGLTGRAYTDFFIKHKPMLTQLDALNLTTRQTYFDQNQRTQTLIAWRHFSFCEWFAGLHLSKMAPEQQERWIETNTFDSRWYGIFRFALSAADRDKELDENVVNHLATCLLKYGAAFLLWEIIEQDSVLITTKLDLFCRWLVHRDSVGCDAWLERPDKNILKIELDEDLVEILNTMFECKEEKLNYEPKYRDSRWLHPAWELVETNLPGSESTASDDIKQVCQKIHDNFLSEFEKRVLQAAKRNRGRKSNEWEGTDRGILQLVPEDCFLESPLSQFKLLTQDELDSFRTWPASEQCKDYRQRRDQFNRHLRSSKVNYCLCPPRNWERPDGGNPQFCMVGENEERKKNRIPPHYMLQRTPMTNLQFEVFDPLHQRFREWQWRRPEESDENQLDDHPVVEVSFFMSKMMTIWMTGKGTLGMYDLPEEQDWEACCRAGRDAEVDRFGIPWTDKSGVEHFDSLSSKGANLRGNYSTGKAPQGEDRNGTIPVDNKSFPGNGFGLCEMHGQVWEWCESTEAEDSIDRPLRGGSWLNDAGFALSTRRDFWYELENRRGYIGFRILRTK
ncbi:SUMF1/EgtB/PvdO family nonheme iron enzyme [Gimesia sp.]|uniref:SUMF1/EgtB/PvdO family nonheme iron enzyme n=1 Tax=Gimesia sp. TaxID=2024833 RepID=UPI003A953F4D